MRRELGRATPDGVRVERRPTMDDVAARAGVSRALVSLVFRNQPGPSAPARDRILRAAAELDYRPNSAARVLARSRSRVLGVLVTIRNPFHAELVEAIYPEAQRYDYDVLLSVNLPAPDEHRGIDALLSHPCEALVLLGPRFAPRYIAELHQRVPVVVVGPRPRGTTVDTVHVADGQGVRLAMDHLVLLGHRRIVHVDGGSGAGAAQRRTAYRNALRRHGLGEHTRVIAGDYTEDSGARAARLLLAEKRMPDAIFAANDRCAIGILDVLLEAGVDVPGTVSVVGYDDSPLSGLTHINLTTVRQDAAQTGRLSVQVAVDRLKNPGNRRQEVLLTPTLVVRGTTGPRRR
jgi:DNA-binding LacI/PurR family transcriptional regulator